MFAVKCTAKQLPISSMVVTLIVTTLIFGYQLKIFEGPLSYETGQNFLSIDSCMWNVIITLSSAGYGEIYPKSFFGRIVGMYICFWGVFITSIFVVTVTDVLKFTMNEAKSFGFLMKLFHKKDLKQSAIKLFQSASKHKKLEREEPENKEKILSQFRNFRSHRIHF